MKLRFLLILILSILNSLNVTSQTDITKNINKLDTSKIILTGDKIIKTNKKIREHKPKRAVLLSSILPGAGQAYNKQYWKIPLFYSALGTTIFTIDINNKQYKKYLEGLKQLKESKTDTTFIRTIFPDMEETTLSQNKDKYRRNRDLSFLLFGAIYVLNIIDATVYAHLANFDVSDDLSVKIKPEVIPLYAIKRNTFGLTISFKF